ncbi:MAG: ankyrin repeat domain-containing protein [Deltaproteobacteria bacterium]|nr:ankyrin repeat domain-containing protein [Deltaproteobacteria bacterium]
MKIAKLLIEKNSDINHKNENESDLTPVHISAVYNNSQIIELLSQYGLKLENRDANVWTPLHFDANE